MRFEIVPYHGAEPIRFGMTVDEVAAVFGPPMKVNKNFKGERSEYRDGVNVCYSIDATKVVEIGFARSTEVLYKEHRLFELPDPLALLIKDDPQPFEFLGFIIFLNLGITATGFHDQDESQKAITVFARGRWDEFRPQFQPWGR